MPAMWIPAGGTVIAVLVGVVVVGVGVGLASVGPALTDPIGNRVFPGLEPLRRSRLVPIAAGVLLLAGLAVTSGSVGRSLWLAGFAVAVVVAGIGCPLAIPLLAAASSRPLARSQHVAIHLAGRRLGHEATSVGRIVNGLLVALVISAFAQTLLLMLDWSAEDRLPEDSESRLAVNVENAGLSSETFESIDGVLASLGTAVISNGSPDALRVVVADCATLAEVATTLGDGCSDDAAQAIVFPNAAPIVGIPSDGRNLEFTIADQSGATYVPGDLKVPPGHRLASEADIRDWVVVLSGRSAYDELVTTLAGVAPAAEVQGLDETERGRLIGTYRSLVSAASVVALAMCLGATVVALVDRSFERRRCSGQLLAIGASGAVLRRVEALWVGIPALLGVALTGLVGTLIAVAYMRFGEADLGFPTSLFVGALAVAITGAFALTMVAALSVQRSIAPEMLDIER